jgi:hypothetical protein
MKAQGKTGTGTGGASSAAFFRIAVRPLSPWNGDRGKADRITN